MKNLIRWLVGIVCGLFLVFQIAVHIPAVQRMLGDVTASALKDVFGWDVSIGRIRFGLWNRVIIDDLCLKDKQDSTMLHASRLAAKFNLLPLAKGQISIANVQLFGTQVNIYQSTPQSKPNFQFVLDTFSSNDTTSSNIDLHIGSILLRRVSVDWNQHWKPRQAPGRLDAAHLRIKDIAVTAQLRTLTTDSVNLSLKRLSFAEGSGFSLKNLSFDLTAGERGGHLSNFRLQFPHSILSIPSAKASWPQFPQKGQVKPWLRDISIQTNTSLSLTPSDLSALAPWLKQADTQVNMESTMLFSKSSLSIPTLDITDNKSVDISAKVFVLDIIGTPEYMVEFERLRANSAILQSYVPMTAPAAQKLAPIISRLDTIDSSGRFQFNRHRQEGTLRLSNKYGDLSINASARDWNSINASISSNGLLLNRILSDNGVHDLGKASFDITAKGHIKDGQGKPDINVHASLPLLQWQGRTYDDMELRAHLRDNVVEAEAHIRDYDGEIQSRLTWKHGNGHQLTGNISVSDFHAERLGLGERYPDTRLSVHTDVDLRGNNMDDVVGSVEIRDFMMRDTTAESIPTVGPIDMSLSTDMKGRYRTLNITSAPLNATAHGRFRFSTLATTISNGLHDKLPQLIPYKSTPFKADTLHFSISLQDTALLRRVALQDISVPQRATLEGYLCGHDTMSVRGSVPELHIGSELLRDARIDIQGFPEKTTARLSMDRRHKNGFVSLALDADAHANRLRLIASLENNRTPRVGGKLDISTTFSRNADGGQDIRAWIAPSEVVVSDTVWNVHPCAITWDGQVADISGFKVNQSTHRGIYINGRASANAEDTLRVNLSEINVEYILDLVNFKAVEFRGLATGDAYVTTLLSSPAASADITIDGFAFNRAPLGTLQAKANWGETPNLLSLNATISDPENHHLSTISGGFHLGSKERPNGLDLQVHTQRFNLAFLNLFTEDILEDFQGRASGHCRIYGPFKAIDLEGDMMVDHAHFSLPMLGTSYHLQNDSAHIRPEEISITALLSDKDAAPFVQPGNEYVHSGESDIPHTAVLKGRLMHKHFKDMRYDFQVKANKLLGYDFRDFGESSFYATGIVSGDISVQGMQGRLTVNVDATPEPGTVFTYDVNAPEALTDVDFITINSRDEELSQPADTTGKAWPSAAAEAHPDVAESTNSDIYLDFKLNITPDAKVRLLMDRKSGDMIDLNGSGHIMAKYYNKGRFSINGNYRVQGGTYRLSIQDIIRKEFKFQPGGTINFGGDAMKADLNLQAIYSVNSVSLDDLATTSLGFSKTRVDCIMNLTGHPEQPIITFDFDLPNASEDERQMVRSVVGTDEERNLQAIYLLGLGRFYNFNADGATQSSTAMNSLVSSTLSSHLNNLITTAVGSSNWSLNTYLQTTEDGWRNMDVEGQLSGSLFDNRLLLTGNFGYREKNYTQRNFISDVSIEYLLTRNGMLSVKAYNQANDRYFVQSSLNTQGIGIQYKKDFNRFLELFRWIRPKKAQNTNTSTRNNTKNVAK